MVKPEEVPVRVPVMDTLSPSQESLIQELLAKIDAHYGEKVPYYVQREHTPERRRIFGYRALKARKWMLTDALDMVKKTVEFRAENGIDEWKLFPCAFPLLGFDEAKVCAMLSELPAGDQLFPREGVSEMDLCYRALQTSYVNVYHYWDKDGHPVLYDCCGGANISEILQGLSSITPAGKNLSDVIVPYHVYMNEVQYYLIQYADAVSQTAGHHPIIGITVVMNMDGMSFKMVQRRFIQIVRAIFHVDQAYYPECLHRLFIINAPSFFRLAYDWVKGSLDVNTRNKLVFSSGKDEAQAILRRVIDADKLPQELGGTCRCEGGCLPRYVKPTRRGDEADIAADAASSVAGGITETVHIKKGKQHVREMVLDADDEVTWEFSVDGDQDIRFCVLFHPSISTSPKDKSYNFAREDGAFDNAAVLKATKNRTHRTDGTVSATTTVKESKLTMDVDTFIAPERGMLELTWCNKASWMYKRSIQLRIIHQRSLASRSGVSVTESPHLRAV